MFQPFDFFIKLKVSPPSHCDMIELQYKWKKFRTKLFALDFPCKISPKLLFPAKVVLFSLRCQMLPQKTDYGSSVTNRLKRFKKNQKNQEVQACQGDI